MENAMRIQSTAWVSAGALVVLVLAGCGTDMLPNGNARLEQLNEESVSLQEELNDLLLAIEDEQMLKAAIPKARELTERILPIAHDMVRLIKNGAEMSPEKKRELGERVQELSRVGVRRAFFGTQFVWEDMEGSEELKNLLAEFGRKYNEAMSQIQDAKQKAFDATLSPASKQTRENLKALGKIYHAYHDANRTGPDSWSTAEEYCRKYDAWQKILQDLRRDGVVVHWGISFAQARVGTSNYVLAYEKSTPKSGGWVLRLDGSVAQYDPKMLQYWLQNQAQVDTEVFGQSPPVPVKFPPELTEKIEAARQSDEREGVERKALRGWLKGWIEKNLTPEQKKPFSRFASTRLTQGKKAQPLAELVKLTAIVDRTFEGQAPLDEWFEENNISKSLRGLVMRQIPTKTSSIEDVILCLNAADGKTLWRKAYPSKAGGWGASSTPCLVEGRLYVIGGKGTAYCLEADTGEEVWQTELKQGNVSSSFTHLDGKLFIAARRLVALEAQSGKLLWEQKAVAGNDSSPVVWRQGGKAYIICGGKKKISCIDPGTGEVLWSTKGAGVSTPAVAGATMIVQHGKGMRVYRVSPTAAEEVVELPLGGSRGGSPVNDGAKAYSTSGKEAVCLNAESGEIIWKSKGVPEQFSSAILADGKLVCLGGKGSLALLDASSGKRLGDAKVGSVQCASPTLAKGKLYVRTAKGVSCFDLAK